MLENEGLLQPRARRYATHFSHNRTPPYLECAEFFAPHGIEPAYDGLGCASVARLVKRVAIVCGK